MSQSQDNRAGHHHDAIADILHASLTKGIVPVLLGNILGGGLFVGTYYWWMYLCGSPDLTVDGTVYEPDGNALCNC